MQSLPLSDCPQEISSLVTFYWEQFVQNCRDNNTVCNDLDRLPDSFWADLVTVWGGSSYVAQQCCHHPDWLLALAHEYDTHNQSVTDPVMPALALTLADIDREDLVMEAVRQFRHRTMVGIIWRDLTNKATLIETTAALTQLAEECIDASYQWYYQYFSAQWGTPAWQQGGKEGKPQHMVILGMGKLGAGELNLSSDIDLIFAYPQAGQTEGKQKAISNQEFFVRLGQKLISALDANTKDGFAFRVDMRLRPYGQSGALVLNFDAMEQYYQDQGRDWERFAMIKARVVGGDKKAGGDLLARLKPFVFRRYVDFSAVNALREMKQMISREVVRKGRQHNIKLGPGGIREVEFIVQAFQLIHGGRDPALQQKSVFKLLNVLAGQGYLPLAATQELESAYHFLRKLEHALQAWADQQTQDLPKDKTQQCRLAWSLGFADWSLLAQTLEEHRKKVSYHFSQMVAEPTEEHASNAVLSCWQSLWQGQLSENEATQQLIAHQFQQPETILQRLQQLASDKSVRMMQRKGRQRLDAFMPILLAAAIHQSDPSNTLLRVLPLVERVLRRTAYILLLIENPVALQQLLKLCAASPWIADTIARYPMLLDEFLDVGSLYSPPDKETLADELRQQLARVPEDDIELQMETLRYFRMAHVLRVAASEVAGTLPLMKVSDYLTWIAEAVLEHVLYIALHYVQSRYGHPGGIEGDQVEFIVIAYGKLAGIELSYGSDLDLVFVYNAPHNQSSSGPKEIDNSLYFMRLGQRMIHILTAQTPSGQLYDVDMRLRPSGASGLLVSTINAYAEYQADKAWTWEHQALVRARVVAGSPQLTVQFSEVRAQVLSQARDQEKLKAEVISMRNKMRDNLATKETNGGRSDAAWLAETKFNLKHDYGGIVDIEFMVQYMVLAWSHQYSDLLTYTDNIRILEELEKAGLLAPESANLLREAYKAYRSAAHRLVLQNQSGVVTGDSFHEYRQGVVALWQQLLGDTPSPVAHESGAD
ncbi:bifunctional [glutamate--ammonia ligase]-adenylyl-L-tyrosine phosphorylase/[glutamate--ammonia-ligase] adenylyltransferase [Zooshikella ganghwensis]|uniref:Bifunctional glutamine synthetase adenylyltransferase/adenylyl-removing enzyme n=1 Tax=Zooshikella ganghwensis TaxID=202772 RepID=A0A4P9VH13_9GAMM|nr:bifunctional [glutamate--ammonia ligase]-adenylyl-L-tyrosine phosphorylase/[glutamate--ammonia-ligase] adenylyltransferase [Zooshikella ganghwensis]RDH42455.1 bifunctional [glutamate--ammonia ligase]-adenylyl-L-tyrosine phosphorylase/[glutamate--ammonia-ligase] adenylyltransferase [Zooshikella ganghwensis]